MEILQEQVKPTISVFLVGGIDALLDILLGLFSALSILSSSGGMAYFVTHFMAILTQYLQSANHALVYNAQ